MQELIKRVIERVHNNDYEIHIQPKRDYTPIIAISAGIAVLSLAIKYLLKRK